MSIRIDENRCIGCGSCADICPGNLIKLSEQGRARIRRPKDCWGCTSCVKECPVQAISFYIGADIGGMGSTLNVTRNGSVSRWRVTLRDGSERVIEVNAEDSNRY